jgi:hypothetical protein
MKSAAASLAGLLGRTLAKPEVLSRAARVYPDLALASPAFSIANRIASQGGSELLSTALPGAVLGGVVSTMATGNPLAGLAVGAADLGLSYGGARALEKLRPQMAGKYGYQLSPKQYEAAKQGAPINVSQLKGAYTPSAAQHGLMYAGSVGATLGIEPLFMQQKYAEEQAATQAQQLQQMQQINGLQQQMNSPGTLYQMQGLPYRTV